MDSEKKLVIYIDGAAKGNPGPAGAGMVICEPGSNAEIPIRQIGEYLGEATNNVAEYLALVFALQEALDLKATHVLIYSDSELLTRQFNGIYKVKNSRLKTLYAQSQELVSKFKQVKVEYIARERNKLADRLATEAIKRRN